MPHPRVYPARAAASSTPGANPSLAAEELTAVYFDTLSRVGD
jgi:hypothetical protein